MAITKLPPELIRQHKGVSFTGVTTVFFCYDDSNRVFLVKRSQHARDEQGRWHPGAGGLKHGQSIEDNVRRELQEEYAVEPLLLDFIGYFDVFRELDDGTPTHWLAMTFAVKVDPAQLHINEPDLADDFGWFYLNDMPTPLHSQFNKFLSLHGQALQQVMERNSGE